MRYHILASDYDGTLAEHGQVHQSTITALENVLASGRQLLLITGRMLPDLQQVFPTLDLFTYVVAENGGLLYHPTSQISKPLASPPPQQFVDALRAQGVAPLVTGEVIVATDSQHAQTVQRVINDLQLDLQPIFNKGALMILPASIDKTSGLLAALTHLNAAPANVVGIGDAENDTPFLMACGFSVAVNNALPELKAQADYTTKGDRGQGVAELVQLLIANDLHNLK